MFYNCHIHTFTDEDVPDKYLPLAIVKALKTRVGSAALTRFLRFAIPFSTQDMFERYAQFIQIGKLRDQQRIFHECSKYYPHDTRFFVLAIDMEFMGAGKTRREYKEQLEELGNLALKDNRVLPFMMVDPRRPNVLSLLQEMVEVFGFRGIKLYPTMGYFPYDPLLDPIYSYCTQKNISVMAHCGPFNPTYFKGKKSELLKLLEPSLEPIETKGKTKQELCTNFTHPGNYHEVFRKFPELKICLAHFGSSYYWERYIHNPEDPDNWFSIIKDMLPVYKGLYTDVSFTMNHWKYFSLLKVLLSDLQIKEKVLFGSDFYMVKTRADERRFGLDLRAFLGEENFDFIARKNPENYLA